MRVAAASGRKRRPAISAAVEKPEDWRKPERFFGHRKAFRSETGISAAVEKPEDQRKPERFFGHRKADRWREAPDEVPPRVGSDPLIAPQPRCHPEEAKPTKDLAPGARQDSLIATGTSAAPSVSAVGDALGRPPHKLVQRSEKCSGLAHSCESAALFLAVSLS